MKTEQLESIPEKAARLKNNSRVIIIGREKVLVIGDTDTHKVEKKGLKWACDCRWYKCRGAWQDCSHILAAKQARKDPSSQVAVTRLADWLMEADFG